MKKNYLLAWYGITDLKSSLGLEESGPLLEALSSGKFTNAKILAYLNESKEEISQDIPPFKYSDYLNLKQDDSFIAKFKALFARKSSQKPSDYYKELSSYIDKVSNTPQSTTHFINWLKSKLAEKNVEVEIECISVPLQKLNDSDAIYAASLDALSSLQTRKDIENISLFISPGTPLMAFSWTMASLCIKEIPVEIISSSSVKGGLEHIDLPQKLPNISLQQLNLEKPTEFDVIVHLFGQEPLPITFAIKHFKAKQHVFLTSPDYKGNVKELDSLYDNPEDSIILCADPFSPSDVKDKLLAEISKNNWTKIGFNLTGGTKLMYEGAMQACKLTNGIPFYLESKNHNLIWLNSLKREATNGIGNIENYFTSKGYKVANKGYWTESMENRRKITLSLWKNREEIRNFYKHIHDEIRKAKDQNASYNIARGKATISYNGKNAQISLNNLNGDLPNCPDFTKYITGGWLEEYIYMKLEPAVKNGTISDLRIGLDLDLGLDKEKRENKLQEFDILFKYREKLYIIECKAGDWKRSYLDKLQNNVSQYAGTTGKGFLIYAIQLTYESTLARTYQQVLSHDKNVDYIADSNVEHRLLKLILKD